MISIPTLMWPRLYSIKNLSRSKDRNNILALIAFICLGLFFWVGIFFTSRWFFFKCIEVEIVGEMLVRKILEISLLIFSSILLISNIISAFSSFFLSEEMELLWVAPVNPDAIYLARLVESIFQSSWMILIFGLPLYIAAGTVFQAAYPYYLAVGLALVSIAIISSVVGVLISMALANVFPARRTRDILGLLVIVFFAILYMLFRYMQPEKLLDPDAFGTMVDFMASMGTPAALWLPSTWATQTLFFALRDRSLATYWPHLLMLFSSPIAFLYMGMWLARSLYPPAWSRSREAGTNNKSSKSPASSLGEKVGRIGGRILGNRSGGSAGKSLLMKDVLIFFRDTTQWSQMLLIVALVVVYLVNFKSIKIVDSVGIITPTGLYFMNIGLSGFVISAIAARFVFPAVSLEGRSFWIVKSAPVTVWLFLGSKVLISTAFLGFISLVLCFLTNWVLGTPLLMTLTSAISTLIMACTFSAMGVGFGAVYPRFDVDNVAKIATGYGGILYMAVTMVFVMLFMALSGLAVTLLYRYEVRNIVPSREHLALAIGLLLLGLLVAGLFSALSLRAGAKHLDAHWEP